MKNNKEMSVWSALFGGLTDKKPPKKNKEDKLVSNVFGVRRRIRGLRVQRL